MAELQLFMMVIAAGALGFSLSRMTSGRRRGQPDNPLGEVQQRFSLVETSVAGLLQRMELRVHELGREVEATVNNRILVLDQLTRDADAEIRRLQALLATQAAPTGTAQPASEGLQPLSLRIATGLRLQVERLHAAGFTADRIAELLGAPPRVVDQMLDEELSGPTSQAA